MHGEASKKALGLLRSIFPTGRAPEKDGDTPRAAPFVITIGRPLKRPAVRDLLGCDASSLDMEQCDSLSVDAAENKGTTKLLQGTSEQSWLQLCAATSVLYTFIALLGNFNSVGTIQASAGSNHSCH